MWLEEVVLMKGEEVDKKECQLRARLRVRYGANVLGYLSLQHWGLHQRN